MIDAVGMEAHGSPVAKALQTVTGLLPNALAAPLNKVAGVHRLAALISAIDIVRRGGTISLIGVYGGAADPLPMVTMFDKQIQLRMGQANVLRWVEDIMPLLTEDDPFGSGYICDPSPSAGRRSSRLRNLPRSRTKPGEDRASSIGSQTLCQAASPGWHLRLAGACFFRTPCWRCPASLSLTEQMKAHSAKDSPC